MKLTLLAVSLATIAVINTAIAAGNSLAFVKTEAKVKSSDMQETFSLEHGFKLSYARQFNDVVGFQLDYAKYGDTSIKISNFGMNGEVKADVSALNIFFRAEKLLTDHFAISGRMGVSRWKAGYTFNLSGGPDRPNWNDTDSKSGTDFAYGIGAGLLLTRNVGFRIEYDIMNADDDLKSTSIGLDVRF